MSNFHTIKSILNLMKRISKSVLQLDFHTIKSILNKLNFLKRKSTKQYFHTIKSILNLNGEPTKIIGISEFPYY